EIAKAEPSTAWSLGQNSGCLMSAPYLDPAVAREIFGPPRGILAWGPDLPGAGRGVAVEGGIRVTGRWGFATGSRHATWLGAHRPRRGRSLNRTGARQGPARFAQDLAREQCEPVRGRTMRGETALGARLDPCDLARDVGGRRARRRLPVRTALAIASRRDLGD